jgi:integrase
MIPPATVLLSKRITLPSESLSIAEAIDPRYRALVFVGGHGGLRIGELAGLRRDRIDMLRGILDVAEQVVEVSGKLSIGPLKRAVSQEADGGGRLRA